MGRGALHVVHHQCDLGLRISRPPESGGHPLRRLITVEADVDGGGFLSAGDGEAIDQVTELVVVGPAAVEDVPVGRPGRPLVQGLVDEHGAAEPGGGLERDQGQPMPLAELGQQAFPFHPTEHGTDISH